MHDLPALLIGGPPHSGKSVLLYSLSQALRQAGVEHYALRACPDGEGDWANEIEAPAVRAIRTKGKWSDQWVTRMCRDIERRHLPLLVDVGGEPTPDQERIFAACTHAILLTKDADSAQAWLERMARHALPLLADLRSDLHGAERIDALTPVLTGTITGLDRQSVATGPLFAALLRIVADLFTLGGIDHRARHLATAPTELAVDLDRLAGVLNVARVNKRVHWQPTDLPALLDYLPTGVPLAAYGRGPIWLQAGLACLAWPADYHGFDPRLGWVQARLLAAVQAAGDDLVGYCVEERTDYTKIEAHLPAAYLEWDDLARVSAPRVALDKGVVISGKLPLWLYTSLAVTYRAAPWLAAYQPYLGGAVICYAQTPDLIGRLLPLPVEGQD